MKRIVASSVNMEVKKSKFDEINFTSIMMKKMLDDKVRSDFVLISGKDGQRFKVHKLVLAAASDYFNAFFKPNFADSNAKEHFIKDVDGPTLEKIVNCCYTGGIALDDQNVYAIIRVANYLRIEYIEKRCIDYISKKLRWDNCVFVYRIADMLGSTILKTESIATICRDLKKMDPNQLRQMDAKLMLEVLKSDKIEADEETIFKKLKEWVESNEKENAQYIPGLMEQIDIERISGLFLLNTMIDFGRKYNCQKPNEELTRRVMQFQIATPTQRYTPAPSNFPPGVVERNGNFIIPSPLSVGSSISSSIGSPPGNVHD